MNLPILQPSGRGREFNSVDDLKKYRVLIAYLIDGLSHREIENRILKPASKKSNGFESMNILRYLGLSDEFKGIFKNYSVDGMIEELTSHSGYEEIVNILSSVSMELAYITEEDVDAEEVESGGMVLEGQERYYYGKRYEREASNRKRAIEIHGVNCIVCDFNFEAAYGERGKDYIEIHHLKPLSTLKEPMRVDAETDLVPVCSNCHRMIHRRAEQVLSPDQLRQLMNNR
ncbi:HNH endonuclease [Exiguobacterium sp. AB2]|uniref:HNH endonuclease n=1 Tax=Exiguobacterium sp. AB2 TaxID=1484479 RepID=UPI0004A950BC|nr:HNH endonuclease [Exiguobacterium sp. AB2]KDN59697.1 hypothetical protein DI14_09095 [Exiguobacterium sp. AB2]